MSGMASGQMHDVVVIGGGNAALCAALTARAAGASVVVLERAPRHFRGGNSRHTRNLRCVHPGPTPVLTGAYLEGEFLSDLSQVSGGLANDTLARLTIARSAGCLEWMQHCGARFQGSLQGTLHLGRTNAFFLGGGKALLNSYYRSAAQRGIDVRYDADVVGLELSQGECHGAVVRTDGRTDVIKARAFVLASGGFESNLEWLREVWGPPADNFLIRGTPYNTGTILKAMLDAGAQAIGDPRGCHAVAIDARAPKFDGGIVTRLDSIPLGIVVNTRGERFYDEGEDVWPKRYAIWGALVARQPDQTAYSIVDARAAGLFIPSVFPPIVGHSMSELAGKLQLPPGRLEATVDVFNRAVRPGTFNRGVLDDCRTEGLAIEKSHWAQRIDTPPYWAYPLRPGITFTYLGLEVDERACVRMSDGDPARNIYAAGEIMAGNVLRSGYIAGIGMTIGTVFGRIAGESAAQHAHR